MPLYDDLLNLARELVNRNPGAPKEVDLRRGVSTAYYALFQLLVSESTAHFVSVPDLRPRVARAFDHKVMRLVCQDYANLKPNHAGQLVTSTGEIVPPQVRDIAREFVALQQARYQADYDTAAIITHAQAEPT